MQYPSETMNLTGGGPSNTSLPCPPGGNLGNYCHPSPGPHGDTSGEFYHLKVIEDILYIIVTPSLSIFGCIGNLINIVVLTKIRARIRKVDGGKEGVTHLGLMILALSDLLFCLSICPRGFTRLSSTMSLFPSQSFQLYYQAYGTGFVTTFILTSTWVTVAMAVLRYVGICHPLAMRRIDSRLYSRIAYSLVIIISVLMNLPVFWQFKIVPLSLGPGKMAYLIDIGFFDPGSPHGKLFLWVRAFYAVFIPATLLAFCNLSLILTLRQSYRMRRACRVQDSAARNSSRITLLLVVLVVMFVLLVFPSEIMDFCTENIRLDAAKTQTFMVVRAAANVLQVSKF